MPKPILTFEGVSIDTQDKIVEYIFPEAEVTSDLNVAWVSCDNSQDELPALPITISGKSGTGLQIVTYQR